MGLGFLRRCVGVLVGGAPLWLAAASLFRAMSFPSTTAQGRWLLLPAVFLALLNAHLSWIRPRLHARRHGSLEGYRHVSGIPLFGNLFAIAALMLNFGNPFVAGVGLAAVLADTGGLPWFVFSTWSDRSLWEGRDGAS